MINSKLIQYLTTLSNIEMRDLGRFIESNSVKGSKDLKQLFDYLKKCHPNYTEKKVKKEVIEQKVFSKESNTANKIKNLLYKFGVLLDDFLIQQELKNNKIDQDLLLLKALRKRKLDKYFFKKNEQLEEEWKNKKEAGIENLHNIYQLKKMHFLHPNNSKEDVMSVGPQVLIQHLDSYYFAMKLYWTLCDHNTKNYFQNKTQSQSVGTLYPIEHIISFLKTEPFEDVPQVGFLGELLNDFKRGDFENYAKFKEAFFNQFELYNKNEQSDLLVFLTEICYENYKKGKENALNDLFELNRFAVEKQIVVEDGYIASNLFLNIINIACAAKQLEWTANFIEKYNSFLEADQRRDVTSLSTAILYFHKKEYDKVLEELAALKFQNIFYDVQARAMQLQSYYELEGYEDLFQSLAKSFGMFLYRNKSLSEGLKKTITNFIHFAKKLQKAKQEYRPQLKELTEELNSCTEISYKSWLLAKLHDLQKK